MSTRGSAYFEIADSKGVDVVGKIVDSLSPRPKTRTTILLRMLLRLK